MSISNKTLSNASRSFELRSAQGMMLKLHRELDRCRAAKTREDLGDACINFSITAYHLCEWVWAAIARDELLRKDAAEIFSEVRASKIDDPISDTKTSEGRQSQPARGGKAPYVRPTIRLIDIDPKDLRREHVIQWFETICPEILWCQDICNGSKHVGGSQVTTGIADIEVPDIIGLDRPCVRNQQSQLSAFIIDNNIRYDAIAVFTKICDAWTWQLSGESMR